MAATPTVAGTGWWPPTGDLRFGNAGFFGSRAASPSTRPSWAWRPRPTARGYWLVGSDGGIFTYGDAGFWGSTGGIRLNKPIVGMAATSDGNGYWMVASDGGIFAFGDAGFFGSTGSLVLNKPIVGMAATPDGGATGWWRPTPACSPSATPCSRGARSHPSTPRSLPKDFSNPIPPVVSIINEVPGPQANHQGAIRAAFAGDSLSLYEGGT